MNDTESKVQLFGTRGSAEAHAIRDFFHRCDVRFQWVELRDDRQAQSEAHVSGLTDKRLTVHIDISYINPRHEETTESIQNAAQVIEGAPKRIAALP